MTPVHPSPPDSDSSKPPFRPKLSKEAKFWIGLFLVVLVLAGSGFLIYIAFLKLFPDNPRLVVRSVRITGSRNWNPDDPNKRQERIDRICGILNINLKSSDKPRTQMFPGRNGGADLPAMVAKLRKEIPELEQVRVYRVLPDQLIFELRERIPVANLSERFYIDKYGVVLEKKECDDTISDSLPSFTCTPSIARGSDDSSPLEPGEILSSVAIRTALTFIRLAEKSEFTETESETNSRITIGVASIVFYDDYLECDIYYNGDPRLFKVLLPLSISEKEFRSDYFGRMIPALDEAVQNKISEKGKNLDLRYKDRVIKTDLP